jgi:hypothetical protein
MRWPLPLLLASLGCSGSTWGVVEGVRIKEHGVMPLLQDGR